MTKRMEAVKKVKEHCKQGKYSISKNKEEVRFVMQKWNEIKCKKDPNEIRDGLAEIFKLKKAYDDTIEKDIEPQFTSLEGAGKRYVESGRLPEDIVAERRKDVRNIEDCLSNKIYALTDNCSKDSRILGISYDDTSGMFTSYISDVLRYVSPDHPLGEKLGPLLGRGMTSNGLEGTVPMFPNSFHTDLVPFGARRNDGSVIAVTYKFHPCSEGGNSTETLIKVESVCFKRIRQPHLLSNEDISALLSMGNSGKVEKRGISRSSKLGRGNNKFDVVERNHILQICNSFQKFKSKRESSVGQQQLDRYGESTLLSACLRVTTTEGNIDEKQDLHVSDLKIGTAENSLACRLFKEIRVVTNHAIALFCEKNGLPILFRGPRLCIDGDDRDRSKRTFRKWYTSPIRNAEAGINTYAPSTNALNFGMDYINQYLLHEHVKLILPPCIGQREGSIHYDTDLTLLDYSSFETSIHSEGIVPFMADMFEIMDTIHILNEEVREKVLNTFH